MINFIKVTIVFTVILLMSCNKEEQITITKEPKETLTIKSSQTKSNINNKNFATIVAIVHQSSQSYFFKLTGEKSAIQKFKSLFKETIKTLKFKDGSLTWLISKPWEKVTNNSNIVAEKYTIEKTGVIFSITKLPYSPIISNVNRWRQQLSLRVIDMNQLRSDLELIQLGNVTVHYIEIIP